ncbi:hypothetical protein HMI54_002531 [Coelomomyces lativittatus]|nr:hypothetical protein HMI55_001057 [Coelomomyces lativittatus]KAJ1507679.1 hypothetical protein HMI56_007667 [Coelomomyces lativittatus]KAJ1509233.1 hypothetical protein HMI54_002531 [Coelomomyces lativittatus]
MPSTSCHFNATNTISSTSSLLPHLPSSSSSSPVTSPATKYEQPPTSLSASFKPSLENLELRPITLENIHELRKVHEALFPVHYKAPFYDEILAGGGDFLKAAYCHNTLMGTICCRHYPIQLTKKFRIYIMTLGILGPYRRLGFGTYLIQHVLTHASKDNDCMSVDLHVQTSNVTALNCYLRLGFSILKRVPQYYRDIDPPDAFFLRKDLHSACTVDESS